MLSFAYIVVEPSKQQKASGVGSILDNYGLAGNHGIVRWIHDFCTRVLDTVLAFGLEESDISGDILDWLQWDMGSVSLTSLTDVI